MEKTVITETGGGMKAAKPRKSRNTSKDSGIKLSAEEKDAASIAWINQKLVLFQTRASDEVRAKAWEAVHKEVQR